MGKKHCSRYDCPIDCVRKPKRDHVSSGGINMESGPSERLIDEAKILRALVEKIVTLSTHLDRDLTAILASINRIEGIANEIKKGDNQWTTKPKNG